MVSLKKGKSEIIFFCGQANRNYHEHTRLFNDVLPEKPVSPSYVRTVMQTFTTIF